MRGAFLVIAFLVITAASAITIQSTTSANTSVGVPAVVSAIVLTLAAGVQRIIALLTFFGQGGNRRDETVRRFAQQTLNRLVRGRRIKDETLTLVIHIWEVPVWYRRLFPYVFRAMLRRRVTKPFLTKYTLRPKLKRVAAVALKRPVPSGVSFTKGISLLGVCLEERSPKYPIPECQRP